MDDQQHELNQAVSEAIVVQSRALSANRALLIALLQVLHWKDPTLKAELSEVLAGLVRHLDELGEDSTADADALNIVSEIR